MRIVNITSPIESINLRLGDVVYLSGKVFTARDRALNRMLMEQPPFNIKGLPLYHAGPLAVMKSGQWVIRSIGPTTSARMAKETIRVVCKYGVPIVIGKGGLNGLGKELADCGAAYLVIPGGVGSLVASKIVRVIDVYWLDLGIVEAVWLLEVKDFGPLITVVSTDGECLRPNLC